MSKFYGKTKSEQQADDMTLNRQIVTEIISFGVKQSQILHIIKLLALELEDREKMLTICECINEFDDDKITGESSGLITN